MQALIFLVKMVVGWLNRLQQEVIDYLAVENLVRNGAAVKRRKRLGGLSSF